MTELHLRPLASAIGAEVRGIDISKDLSDGEITGVLKGRGLPG